MAMIQTGGGTFSRAPAQAHSLFPKRPDRLEVVWEDPVFEAALKAPGEAAEQPAEKHTIGYLVEDTKEYIVLAHEIWYDEPGGAPGRWGETTIPRRVITGWHRLERAPGAAVTTPLAYTTQHIPGTLSTITRSVDEKP